MLFARVCEIRELTHRNSYEKVLGFHRFWSVDDKDICTYVSDYTLYTLSKQQLTHE